MLLKLNQRHWPRLFLWLKVWYSIWMVFYHIESTLLIELTFQRRKSEGGCSEFLDRLLSVGLLEEEKNSSILWLLKHSYWSKVSFSKQTLHNSHCTLWNRFEKDRKPSLILFRVKNTIDYFTIKKMPIHWHCTIIYTLTYRITLTCIVHWADFCEEKN